jgi:hypothetical protein
MFKHLGNTEIDIGTVSFSINDGGFFQIQTPKSFYAVDENELIEKDGAYYYPLPGRDFKIVNDVVFSEIEIPVDIIEEMEKALQEFEEHKNSVGTIETSKGIVFFSIGGSGEILAKLNEKTVKTARIYDIEGKRAIHIPDLGIDFDFIEIPSNVENKFNEFKQNQAAKSQCLEYAGRSLLTGIDFFRFNTDISEAVYFRVKEYIEYFEEGGESADVGGLKGFLTASPELVENVLRIRNPISSRAEEIEKLKENAVKVNSKIIKELTGAAEL